MSGAGWPDWERIRNPSPESLKSPDFLPGSGPRRDAVGAFLAPASQGGLFTLYSPTTDLMLT